MVTTAPAISTKTATNSLKYRADVDGLRAIAVLAVLFYHANLGCTGGFVGVDVFFVISGYLITGIILKDIDKGQFQIRKFWERRILRILPALAVVILSCFIIGWFILLPSDFYSFGNSIIAQAMLATNVFFWKSSGYFTKGVEFFPLLHTWSLAVEEQFYLIFPILLVAIYRFSRKYLLPIILIICAGSFSLSIFWSYQNPDANFYLLPTRAWELGIGALLAIMPAYQAVKMWLAESLSWCGLIAILCAVFFYNSTTSFPGLTASLPVIGTFLIIWTNQNSLTTLGKFLSLPPIVFIGLISYSLYLWHWPILIFTKYWLVMETLPVGLALLLLALSMLLAILSWKFIEIPFRKRIVIKNRPQIFLFAGVTTVVLLSIGIPIKKLKGIPSRLPDAAQQYTKGSIDPAFKNELSLNDALAGNFIELGSGNKQLPIDVFVWGDSTAMAAMPAIDFLCKKYTVRGVAATHSSTLPLIGYESSSKYSLQKDSIAYNSAVVKFIKNNNVDNVVLIGSWPGYEVDNSKVGNKSGAMQYRRDLIETIESLQDTKTRIWIMREVPTQLSAPPRALAIAVIRHKNPEKLGISLVEQRDRYHKYNPTYVGLSAIYPQVTVLDPTCLFVNSQGICRMEENGKSLYVDEVHLTVTGAMKLIPLFEPIFDD